MTLQLFVTFVRQCEEKPIIQNTSKRKERHTADAQNPLRIDWNGKNPYEVWDEPPTYCFGLLPVSMIIIF